MIGSDIAANLSPRPEPTPPRKGCRFEYELADNENLPFETESVRCGDLHVRHHVQQPARSRGRRARARLPQRRTNRSHHLAAGQQRRQDVRGDETVHAASAEPGSAVAVRMGPDRAHSGAARWRVRAAVREGSLLLSRAGCRGGLGHVFARLRSDTVRSRPASTGSGAKRCTRTSSRFHEGFLTELGTCVPREYWVTIGVRS